ncbi:MAG: B12-binding domain-containing radical SAM protein [Deltaproteobacteria bacterium]|nr:B12-binding domain-containing radical SAM protein [Deltaproteobacteria bacterium]
MQNAYIRELYDQAIIDSIVYEGEIYFNPKKCWQESKVHIISFLPPVARRIDPGFTEKWENLGANSVAGYLRAKGIKTTRICYSVGDIVSEKIFLEGITSHKNPELRLIGISAFTSEIPYTKELVTKIRNAYSEKVRLILGGAHASSLDVWQSEVRDLLNYFDFIVVGEGEETLFELAQHLETSGSEKPLQIRGLIFKDNGKPFFTGTRSRFEIKSAEFPIPKVMDRESGFFPLPPDIKRFASIESSRGCPHDCTFCPNKKIWGRQLTIDSVSHVPYKFISPERTAELMEEDFIDRESNYFFFHDSWISPLFLEQLSNELIKRDLGDKIHWAFMSTVKDFYNPKKREVKTGLLKLIRKAGCFQITYGVETVNEEIGVSFNKPIPRSISELVLKETFDAGIFPAIFLIIGEPEETEANLNELKEFMKESFALRFRISCCYPFFGSALREEVDRKNLWLSEVHKQHEFATTSTPVLKSQFIMNEYGTINQGRLKILEQFEEEALREVYSSEQYQSKLLQFAKQHDAGDMVKGWIYLLGKIWLLETPISLDDERNISNGRREKNG